MLEDKGLLNLCYLAVEDWGLWLLAVDSVIAATEFVTCDWG